MKQHRPLPLGVGSTIIYPITGRCHWCGRRSRKLTRMCRGWDMVELCRSCLEPVLAKERGEASEL